MIHSRRTVLVVMVSLIALGASACSADPSTPHSVRSIVPTSHGKSISGFHNGALAAYGVSEITCSSVDHCIGYEGALSFIASVTSAHPNTSVVETDDGGKTW